MSEGFKVFLIVIGFLLIISTFVILLIGSETKVIGETLCVDGRNRMNLEGIMCEDKVERFFGFSMWFSLFSIIPGLLGLYLIKLGLEGVV